MPGPVSGSGNRNHSVNESNTRRNPSTRAATQEESSRIQSRPGTRADLSAVPHSEIQQAIANAQMMGSGVAEVWVNGQLLFFPLNSLQGWGFSTGMNQQMSGMADAQMPEEEEFMSGHEQVWGEGEGPQPMTGGSLRGNMGSSVGGGMRLGYTGSAGGSNPYGGEGAYGGMSQNQFMWDTMVGGQMREDMYAQRQEMRRTEHQMKVKMRMIMFLILMGDIVGAVRAMVFESERQNRMFNRLLVKQLNKVRESKSKVLTAMARKAPPTAHNNTNNPQGAANDQNRQAKYTQWVSVTTQLMSELQNTERQLTDLLSEGRRNINELWESYSGIKEAEARTTRTLIQSFRA